MSHTTVIVPSANLFQAKCSCKAHSPFGSRGDAVEWEWRHHREVEKARAGLRRTPTLRQQRDWFWEKATDLTISEHERSIWQGLADELDHRVDENTPDPDQLELW